MYTLYDTIAHRITQGSRNIDSDHNAPDLLCLAGGLSSQFAIPEKVLQ